MLPTLHPLVGFVYVSQWPASKAAAGVITMHRPRRNPPQLLSLHPSLLARVAGLYVLERLKGEVLSAVAAEHRRAAVERARRAAIHRAAAASAAAAAAAAAAAQGGIRGTPQTVAAAEALGAAHGAMPLAGEAEAEARATEGLGSGLGARRHSRVRFDLPDMPMESAGAAGGPPVQPQVTTSTAAGSPRGGSPSHGGGGPAHSSPTAGGRLEMQYVPLTEAEVLQRLDQQKLWHASQALARHVLAELR